MGPARNVLFGNHQVYGNENGTLIGNWNANYFAYTAPPKDYKMIILSQEPVQHLSPKRSRNFHWEMEPNIKPTIKLNIFVVSFLL